MSTGKKVNTALDNPTNYFTAAALDNRASDINNLLDSIGNGVQVLQAANTGITSLQKLVDSAKSVATQALQATVGYSAKSSVSVSINGATAGNLLGTGAPIDATFTGTPPPTTSCGLFLLDRHRHRSRRDPSERLYQRFGSVVGCGQRPGLRPHYRQHPLTGAALPTACSRPAL